MVNGAFVLKSWPRDDRTIMQMEIDPKLIEAKREYRKRCLRDYDMMRNAYPNFQQMGAQNAYTSILQGLLGSVGGQAAGTILPRESR